MSNEKQRENLPQFLRDAMADSELSFADANEAISDISGLAQQAQEYEKKIKEIEEKLKEKKKQYNELMQVTIPQKLLASGVTELVLDTGQKVKVKPDVQPTIKDFSAFVTFLEERGDADILKTSVEFGKLEPEQKTQLAEALNELELSYEAKENVHAATLKSYIRGLLGYKDDNPPEFSAADIEHLVKVHEYYKTDIK